MPCHKPAHSTSSQVAMRYVSAWMTLFILWEGIPPMLDALTSRALELKFQSGIIPFIFLCQCIHSIPVQLLTSRSHSDSIPHHSNSIPVNPEVYRIPYKVAHSLQFHQEKVHNEYVTRHFQFHTINLTIHHNFWPL